MKMVILAAISILTTNLYAVTKTCTIIDGEHLSSTVRVEKIEFSTKTNIDRFKPSELEEATVTFLGVPHKFENVSVSADYGNMYDKNSFKADFTLQSNWGVRMVLLVSDFEEDENENVEQFTGLMLIKGTSAGFRFDQNNNHFKSGRSLVYNVTCK